MRKGRKGTSVMGLAALLVCHLLLLSMVSAETGATLTLGTKAWQWYKAALHSRPLLTKATTSAVVMTISDIGCQKLERSMRSDNGIADTKPNYPKLGQRRNPAPHQASFVSRGHYDWHRTRDVAVTGFTWSGPVSHTWYAILESVVTVKQRSLGVLVRLALDATVFSPIAVAGYFAWRAILEGHGIRGVEEKLRAKWKGALRASLRYWPLANILNYGLVPVEFRVLYNNMLSVFWTGYLSHVNAKRMG